MADSKKDINPYVLDVCRLGQGSTCCRYLVMGGDGFECSKLDPSVKVIIDNRVANGQFNAKGDNCEGKKHLSFNYR